MTGLRPSITRSLIGMSVNADLDAATEERALSRPEMGHAQLRVTGFVAKQSDQSRPSAELRDTGIKHERPVTLVRPGPIQRLSDVTPVSSYWSEEPLSSWK